MMPGEWILNVIGLAITTVAAALMFFFPPVLTVYTKAGEKVVSWVGRTSDTGITVAARQHLLSRVAVGLLALGFFLQFLAALPHHGPAQEATRIDAESSTSPPAECAAAESADECADILARAKKNPLWAYGVVGREPNYRRRSASATTARAVSATEKTSPSAPEEPKTAGQAQLPYTIGIPIPLPLVTYNVTDRPFERFGLDVAYGLVSTLYEDTATKWQLFEYSIGLYEDVVRATYGADAMVRRIEAKDLVRSTDLICRAAAKQLRTPAVAWTVVLRFVRWQDSELLAGPFSVRQADCR